MPGTIVIHHVDKRWSSRRVISMIPEGMGRGEFDSNPDVWQFQIGELWRPRWKDIHGHKWEDTSPGAGWNYEFNKCGASDFYLEELGWCRTQAEIRSIPALRDRGVMSGPGFVVTGKGYRG